MAERTAAPLPQSRLMAIDIGGSEQRLPKVLYHEADRLDELSRRQEINSPIRLRLQDVSEQLREIARLEIRLGVPY